MVLLSIIWGLQQVMVKAVSADMAPVLQMSLRSGIAALLVTFLIRRRGDSLVSMDTWKPGLLAGILFALEFLFVGEGLRYTSASHMVVFLYSTPIFVALALHWKFPSERLSTMQWVGVILAFTGIAAAFLGGGGAVVTEAQPNQLLGDSLALLAAISWAATTVVIRSTPLSKAPATQTLWYQLVVCFALLFFVSLVTDQLAVNMTPAVWGNLAFQSLIVSFGSLFLWFWLLRQYPASQLGVFTFMTPLFGVSFGVLLLGEPLDNHFIVGAVLVMMGIVVVNGHGKIRQVFK